MIEQEIVSWTDAIVYFFENEIKKSELYKAKDAYSKKIDSLKKEKDQKKKMKLVAEVQCKAQSLLKLRKARISGDIKAFIYDWAVRNKTPYAIPVEEKLITKVTHPLKYAHSADLNTGICSQSTDELNWISTAAINNKRYDLTQHNGAIIQLVRFFGVVHNSEMLYDLVVRADFSFLNDFHLSSADKVLWQNQLKSWVDNKEIKTAGRAKQVYFPFSEKNECQQYDLLIPMFSSTLSFELYERIFLKRFSILNKEIKAKKDKGKYLKEISVNYPNLAALEYGNGRPQNISLLNTTANGLSYLLPCAPPKYEKVTKPLLGVKSAFENKAFSVGRVKDALTNISEFLVRFSLLNLSVKNPKKIIWLEKWCDQIIEEFFQYVYELHELKPGWTDLDECTLAIEYKLLLDPYRNNKEFQEKLLNNHWHQKIINDFAFWLSRALESNNKKFTGKEWHLAIWRKRLASELRTYTDEVKQVIKM